MTAKVYAAPSNFTFDGVKLRCEKISKIFLKCLDGKKEIAVVVTKNNYVIYDQFDPPKARYATKVSENGKLLLQHSERINIIQSQEMQRQLANTLILGTKDLKDSYSKQVGQQASNFLNKSPEFIDNLNVVLSEQETLNCTKGESSAPKSVCTYYSCNGSDPKEKILFYMPPIGSLLHGPSVIAMKDGQARYYDDNFSVVDKSKSIVSVVNKSNYTRHNYNPAEFPQKKTIVNPELLIPTKYNASKTSYAYLQHFAKSDQDKFGLKAACNSPEILKLFNEQKKIASEMKDYLVYADIVSYVTAINGNVQSTYIDKVKAQSMGCTFQDKIIDYTALPELQRIENLSGINAQTKYPSEKDVQDLFRKARLMTDIPFDYKDEGCFARAHILARRFENMGITVKKAWIQGDLRLRGTDINWSFHVAPLIEAKDNKGNIVQYVIDPSVTDVAVTLDEWVASMDKGPGSRVMKTTYPIAENGLDFGRTVVAVSSSDPFGPKDTKHATEVQKMQEARQLLAEFSQILEEEQERGRR